MGMALLWGGILKTAARRLPRLSRVTLLLGILWSMLLAGEFLVRLAEFENDVATDRAAIRDLQRIPVEERTPQLQASLLLSRGMVLRAEERLEEATAALEQASRLDPSSLRIRVLLASLLHDTDRDSLAKTILEDVLDPSAIYRWSHTELSIYYMTGIVLLSDILTEQGETQEALSWLQFLIRRFPASWKAHSKLAIVQAQAGDSTAALESFQRALILAPRGRWEQEIRGRIRIISQ
jgi:tetratricopeptide (TPR) repeat protein